MAWINVPGLAGKVYLPDDAGRIPKKHPCKTCFACRWCDENCCRVCRSDAAETGNSASPNSRTHGPSKTPKTHRP